MAESSTSALPLAPESAERPDTLRANIAHAVGLITNAKADGDVVERRFNV